MRLNLGFDPDDPESVKRWVKKNAGGATLGAQAAMVFVELTELDPKTGEKWDKEGAEKLSAKWTTLLRSGSTEAEVYHIGDNRLLINIKKGWMSRDIFKFVLSQNEAVKITKDNKDITKQDIIDDEDEF